MPELWGMAIPRGARAERIPVGWKYVIMLALVVPALVVQRWWLTAALLGLAVALTSACRLGWAAVRLPWGLTVFLLVIIGYQGLYGQWVTGLTIAGDLVLALVAVRFVVMTTSTAALLDALVTAATPLRWVGLSPERFGLAVALMVRSVPHVGRLYSTIRAAAAARGLGRVVVPQVTTLVVGAVAYAQSSADALAARGLDAA